MEKISVLVVDDESKAREVLVLAIKEFCPQLNVVAEAGNMPQAVKAIHNFEPQLVFLDLEMPGFSGLQLFEFFNTVRFKVIVTSAHTGQYQEDLDKHQLPVLSKPIQIDQLVKLVNRLI